MFHCKCTCDGWLAIGIVRPLLTSGITLQKCVLALLKTGDRVRIDLKKCSADMLVPLDELAERARAFEAEGYPYPENHSPWQELFREKVGRFDEGMILKDADNYRDIARKYVPRDNH